MPLVVDSVVPSPVVIPRNGSVAVVVTAHSSPGDDPGTIDIVFTPAGGGTPVVLASVEATIDDPTDPVPWADVDLVPLGLPGVTVVNNGNGSYTVTHSET